MIRGGKFLLAGGCLAAAACVQTQSVKVRAIADPSAKVRFSGGLLGEARGQLALGDVGVALETFRTLSRQQPENPDAYAGIAACYAAMGRYDVARQNYEFALAYAPNDPVLLTALASSLDRLGEADQAAQIRIEAARLSASPAAPPSLSQAEATPMAVPRLSSVTVKLPAPSRAASAPLASSRRPILQPAAVPEQTPEPAIAAPQLTPPEVKLSSAPLAPKWIELASSVEMEIPASTEAPPAPTPAIAAPEAAPRPVKLSSAAFAPKNTDLASNVKVSIPVEALLASTPDIAAPQLTKAAVRLGWVPLTPKKTQLASNVEMAIPAGEASAPSAAAKMREPVMSVERPHETVIAEVDPPVESGPRLERLSSHEVSLVTTSAPVRVARSWPRLPQPSLPGRTDVAMNSTPARLEPRLASATPVRWVPLKYAPSQATIQLLNAARAQSLAAQTRVALLGHGWHKIRIGNALKARQHSLVLYASARSAVAHRLAAHFGCRAVRTDRVQNVVVLLGRDIVLGRRGSARA